VSDNSTTQCLLFPDIFPQSLSLQFDQRQGSSDGGALLLKAADRRYGLIACMADRLRDERQAGKVDLGARVLVSVRRVVVHLPASFPFLPAFRQVALALEASPA
jgi:hypothetical protein